MKEPKRQRLAFRRAAILTAFRALVFSCSALAAAAGCGPEPVSLNLKPDCNPFATSDVCVFPYPSAFFQREDPQSPTGVRMDYPQSVFWVPDNVPTIDVGPTNTADGCSPAGPILVHFARDIHPDHLTGQREVERSLQTENPMALFDLETGERVMFMSEMDMNRDGSYPDRYALIIRPVEPMAMGHRHVAVLTRELTDDQGTALPSPRAFEVLRDGVKTTADVIENTREHYEVIFDFLETRGYPRSRLLLAWDFMVASADYLTGSVRSMREETLLETAGTGLAYEITSVQDDPNAYTARLVQGTFEVPAYLNENNEFEYDADHHPIRMPYNLSFPFAMLIPLRARTDAEPLPLVVFGHGLFGSGVSYLAGWGLDTFSEMAEAGGAVLVATDWIGLSEGDLDLIIQEVVPNLNRITLITDRLQQSLVNNLTLTELALGPLSEDVRVKIGQNDLLDPDRVYYYGVSLGGIQGASFVSISPRVTRAMLAVPGCSWLTMLTRSVHWNLVAPFVDTYYPDPLLKQIGIAIIQSRFDLSDPVNLTRHLYQDPLPDAPPDRRVLLLESIGDSQVPNLTTEMLARAVGAGLVTPSVYDVSGLETITPPTTQPAMVQYHMVEQAEADPPPEQNIPPGTDNGVHSDILFLPHVVDQTLHFLMNGEIAQYCSGPCDPD